METKIIRDMEQCYLVLQADKEAGFQQKMIMQNEIPGLLTTEQRKIDSQYQYYYNITDKISLVEYYAKNKISSNDIKFLFQNIMLLIQEAREYLLEPDNFVLQEDTIFFNSNGTQLFICFYELNQVAVREQMVKLAELLMELIDYKEEQAIILTYGLYKVLRDDTCNIRKVEETIEKYSEEKMLVSKKVVISEETVSPSEKSSIEIEAGIMNKKSNGKVVKTTNLVNALASILFITVAVKEKWIFYHHSNHINIGRLIICTLSLVILNVIICKLINAIESQVLSSRNHMPYYSEEYEEEGTVLIANYTLQYVLQKEGGTEQLKIDSFPFVIGSGREGVSGAVQYIGVSKRHAIIEEKENTYQIMDLNSTNGTFLNGELLNPMEPYTLTQGDKITLANITYQFIKL